jgi:hypothetical protein
MECENINKNMSSCNCSYEPCARKGKCCECVQYHRRSNELPACFFPDTVEKTYDRSFKKFIQCRGWPVGDWPFSPASKRITSNWKGFNWPFDSRAEYAIPPGRPFLFYWHITLLLLNFHNRLMSCYDLWAPLKIRIFIMKALKNSNFYYESAHKGIC